ncbi:hypothetical protein RB201_37490 [Streptomyces sp. S1A(2023)]
MHDGGRFHRRHLLAEARRHLALVLRGRRREQGLVACMVWTFEYRRTTTATPAATTTVTSSIRRAPSMASPRSP